MKPFPYARRARRVCAGAPFTTGYHLDSSGLEIVASVRDGSLCLVQTPGRCEMTKTISVAGTTLELVERGEGRPLLFLHAGEGLAPERRWLELLSRDIG